ncbi:MAG: YegP family protein [Clostridiales bacterium]|nr:YegP family protein [Clostridiales bacterium]
MRKGTFIILQKEKGFTFNLKAGNGECILVSELYNSEDGCRNGIASVKKNAPVANIEDQTVKDFEEKKNPKFQIYTDKSGKTRFRLRARNGEVIGVSEPYKSKQSCKNGINSVIRNSSSEIK